MANYLLDTGIILGYIRASYYAEYAQRKFQLMGPTNTPLMSIVSVGEIYSLATQFQWGARKKKNLEMVLNEVHQVDINSPEVLQRYAEIDAYSQGKLKGKALPVGMKSARNMSKNDLWIAATASILNAGLVTTDKDFTHLDQVYLKIIYIDPSIQL